MEINELPIIKISVVGPPNSGKTTLITLLYEYMSKISKSDGSFEISCSKYKVRQLLDGYLSIVRNNKELPKTNMDVFWEFEFEFSIKTFDRKIIQKITVSDTYGDIIKEWYYGGVVYEQDEYGSPKKVLKKYLKHLHESQILLLTTDMPVIMEDDSPKFIKSHSALGYSHIKSIAIDWRNYRKESGVISFAHLVMTKCETYYSRENSDIKQCEKSVKECFQGILEELYQAEIGVLYTPVFISGFKVFNKDKSTWRQIDKITWRYDEDFDDVNVRINPYGINDIWNSIFDLMAYNMSHYLKDGLGKQSLISFGKDETKEIAIKAIDFFMKIMELKTENINDNFNYNKFLKPRWKKNT